MIIISQSHLSFSFKTNRIENKNGNHLKDKTESFNRSVDLLTQWQLFFGKRRINLYSGNVK